MAEQKLPQEFKKYFWDVDFKKISLGRHFNQVVGRLLNYDDEQVFAWLLNNVEAEKIKQYVLEKGKRQLDKNRFNFWKHYFNLPISEKKYDWWEVQPSGKKIK